MKIRFESSNYHKSGDRLIDRFVFLLLGLSIALNIYFIFFKDHKEKGDKEESERIIPQKAPVKPQVDAFSSPAESSIEGEETLPRQVEKISRIASPQKIKMFVKENIYKTFVKALGKEEGEILEAFFSRIFMWRFDLRKDVRNGDEIEIIYRWNEDGIGSGEEVDRYPEIIYASYLSKKNNTTYKAYRYKGEGMDYPRYYNQEGEEYALTLINSPIDHYEEITSLLHDRYRHNGIDFKTPVGTKVKTPFRAKVIKKNWNLKYNGNCVELEYIGKGVKAIFLHLSTIYKNVVPGNILEAGEVFAESGNTGRTTGPHLHYQLESSSTGKIIDPMKYHETYRRSLKGQDLKSFKEYISKGIFY